MLLLFNVQPLMCLIYVNYCLIDDSFWLLSECLINHAFPIAMALNKPQIEEIVKYLGKGVKKALVISAIPLALLTASTAMNLVETSSKLECGLTPEEINAEKIKHTVDYYGGKLGRHIAFYLVPQNPQRDPRCWDANGHYVGDIGKHGDGLW